jgi:beta-galactosidase
MNIIRLLLSFVLAAAIAGPALALAPKPARDGGAARTILPLDAGWHFFKGDAPGAEQAAFADTSWRTVDVPHDWSIEGPFDEKAATRGSGAFLPSGVAWYRKNLTLPADAKARRVFVEFDGVMANSDVWINGAKLGHRPFGYASFRYELTGHLNFGANATNVLAVRADTSQEPASRWYTGAGIYRHVRLIVTDPVHVDTNATFVTTPKMIDQLAEVHLTTTIVNQSAAERAVSVEFTIINPQGIRMAGGGNRTPRKIAAGQAQEFEFTLPVPKPQFWQLDSPVLYRAIVAVRAGEKTLDDDTVAFGIRDAHFDTATGFRLNGKNFKLYGVCVHHDGGAFGAAVPMAVWEQRLGALRTLGVNAIRTAHNPPDPAFLDLCDRMGFLVMDELFDCWEVAKNPFDYHVYFDEWSKTDIRDTVRRDRNHPSVVLWSAGNEIHDTPKETRAKEILSGLVPVFHENDPTRPVTQALFRPNVSHDYTNGLADMLDVIGTNYRDSELIAAWSAKPGRKIVGTEQRHDRQTWLELRDHPQHSGQFLWSGVDYLGEAFRWPMVSSGSGLLDRAGQIKPMALERRAWWSATPVVGIVRRTAASRVAPTDPGFVPLTAGQVQFADWTPRNTAPHEETVEVYSNAQSVELFLNDKSLGAQRLPADASPRNWRVTYAPGTLRAVAKNADKVVATDELRTAGAPAKIVLTADRPKLGTGWDDVVRVTAEVTDAAGVRIPAATDTLTFAVTGPGAVVAVDNADSRSHEPFQATQRAAFNGRALAFVRATGTGAITLTASAPNLASGSTALTATK